MVGNHWMHKLQELRSKLELLEGGLSGKKYILNQAFHENWFSDALAWILDPRGSHGLGIKPLRELITMIALQRSDKSLAYRRRASFLKHGKDGVGIGSTSFSLKNASLIRDFHLTRSLGARPERSRRYCDLIVMDFDSSDNLIIVIENKLGGDNRPNQLGDYYQSAEAKFKRRVKCREYVYITLTGKRPISHQGETNENWVCLGWIPHILPFIEQVGQVDVEIKLRELKDVLTWIKALFDQLDKEEINDLRQTMLVAYSECLIEELKRLTKVGIWSLEFQQKSVCIQHSSHPARMLKLRVRRTVPSIEVEGVYINGGKRIFETIVFPCNIHPTQTKNLIDLYAVEILNEFFASPKRFKNTKRWIQNKDVGKKQEYVSLFHFLYDFPSTMEFLFAVV